MISKKTKKRGGASNNSLSKSIPNIIGTLNKYQESSDTEKKLLQFLKNHSSELYRWINRSDQNEFMKELGAILIKLHNYSQYLKEWEETKIVQQQTNKGNAKKQKTETEEKLKEKVRAILASNSKEFKEFKDMLEDYEVNTIVTTIMKGNSTSNHIMRLATMRQSSQKKIFNKVATVSNSLQKKFLNSLNKVSKRNPNLISKISTLQLNGPKTQQVKSKILKRFANLKNNSRFSKIAQT